MYMTDKEMVDLIETLNCVFEDYMDNNIDPLNIASVMLAVAVKQLRRTLDKDEFDAIIKELSSNQFDNWDELVDKEFEEEIKKKRIIH